MNLFTELRRRNVVRVGVAYVLAAWLLLQVIEFGLEAIGAPGWILQVFLLAAAVGLPAVLVFSWVFELTPEGIKRESTIDRSQTITGQTGRRLDRVIIATLVLVVAVLLTDRLLLQDRTSPVPRPEAAPSGAVTPAGQPAIAVLPFVNMSPDAENEYFSDGIAEEILNVLARVPELKVSARTSAFTYKGSSATIAQIAEELGVNHVLEGSVRKAGNQVRVTAQLIEADSGFHLWSDTYDRELTDIFAIQDDIARAIAGELKVRLLPAADQPNLTGTTDLEAYELYLQGVNLWHLRTGVALERARELLEQAVARDPTFARAQAYLALTWAVLHDYTDRLPSATYPKAGEAARRALELDSQSIEAATALIYSTPDLLEQRAYAEQAIALNPGFATTHQWYGTTLLALGDIDGAEQEYRRARALDPRSRVINENFAFLLVYQTRYDEAEQMFRHLLSFAPDFVRAHEGLFQIALLRGERERAEQLGNDLARSLGRTRNATPLYLDLFFNPEKRAAAAAEIVKWPLEDWDDPDNPSLIKMFDLALILGTAGAYQEGLQVLRWQRDNAGVYVHASARIARYAKDFLCRPEVQAFYADTDLPPIEEPLPCP